MRFHKLKQTPLPPLYTKKDTINAQYCYDSLLTHFFLYIIFIQNTYQNHFHSLL